MKNLILFIFLSTLFLLLGACGLSGPLYLPSPSSSISVVATPDRPASVSVPNNSN